MSTPTRRPYEYNAGRLASRFTAEQKQQAFQRDYDDALGGVQCADPRCTLPIGERDAPFMDLHHLVKPGLPGSNFLENKRLSHHICNARLGRPIAPSNVQIEREQEGATLTDKHQLETVPGVSSAREGNAAAKMRPRFNLWIRGLKIAAHQDGPIFPLADEVKRGRVVWESVRLLARKAVHGCGMGSSKTYFEYFMEDVEAGGIFELRETEGQHQIRYTQDFAKDVQTYLSDRREEIQASR